jgi:hypothetical protein
MDTDELLHYDAKHGFIGVGQRLQIIKGDDEEGGVLESGTDAVHNNSFRGFIWSINAVNHMPEVS